MAGQVSFGSYATSSSSQPTGYDANDFLRLSQAISNNIQKISQNVSQMNSLLHQYGTTTDSVQIHDKLHDIQHYTNQLAKDTNKYLKDLAQLPVSSASEQRQQKIQKERLLNEFSKVLASFQEAQRLEKEKEKVSSISAQRRNNAVTVDLFGDFSDTNPPSYKETLDEDFVRGYSGPAQLSLQTSDVELDIVREREHALRQLESDIMDVNQIFKDLGMLVHEQGDVIDSIEANVESAAANVEQGTEQLRQARKHQSSARKKKCIIITVLLIIVAIIIIILAVVLTKK